MENGIGIAEDAKLGEINAVSSESSQQSVKENVELNLDGSKDSDGDEVFEEAVEEETATVGSENSTMTKDENVESINTLEDNNYKGSSDLFHEARMLEDVTEATDAVQSSEDAGAKMEKLTPEENHSEKQMEMEKIMMDETNDSAVEDGKGDYSEIVDSARTASETEGESNRKLEDNTYRKKSFLEALTSGGAKISDADNKEESIVEMSETVEPNDDVRTFPHELMEGGDICSDIPENGSLDHVSIEDGEKAIWGPEFDSNGDNLHKNGLNVTLGSDYSANLHSEQEDGQVDAQDEMPRISYANTNNDDDDTEVKKLELESAEIEKADSQVVDQEANNGVDAEEHPVIDDSTLNLEKTEVEPQLSSSELLAESSKYGQPEPVNASTEVSSNIIERREQEGVADEKKVLNHAAKVQKSVSQDTSANAKQEIKSASNLSSSAKSVTTQPAGLSQTIPLPVPAQTKERVSNSATPARPAGLGSAAPLMEPTSRVAQQPRVNGSFSTTQNQIIEDPTNADVEEYDETREKLQMIRVKFLRLAHRLGQTPHNVVVAQVLYRLGLAEQLHGRSGRVAAFSFDRASAMAEQLETSGQEPLDFTCTIMVLGKSGVGKSATINSIFDEVMFGTDAFQSGTKKVEDIVGIVQGIRVRVIDTPGLLPSWSDQRHNEKILGSVKRFIKKTPPDIVLYLDRLDMQSRDFGDMPLLRTITEIFGPSIWFNAIVVLTHAASAPPDGPNGTATSYDMFVTQRSHVVQQAIRQAAGDMRLMNPVSLVENHSACRTNRAGQRVLPNGQVWKPHLLLLSFASKILAEANTLLKLQDTPPGRPLAPRTRSLPLPFLLSSLLQSKPEVKLPSEQIGGDDDDNDVMDDDLDECSDLEEEESEYDNLPPFKPLTKSQLENLSKAQRKAYYDELEYREKLFVKKQLREERKRRKMMKTLQETAKDLPFPAEHGDNNNNEEETSGVSSVPIPMPDLALPASFDSDNPTHRYRSLDTSNPWLVRAVLDPNGWDHDIGYDGINVERLYPFKEKIPIFFSGHISKDKKDTSLQMEVTSSIKHGKGKATSLGLDMQSVGKDYAYTLRSETRLSNHRINKATAGLSATVVGDVLTGGVKVEDKLIIGKRGQLVVSGGAIYGRGEVAYGGSLEATLKDKDYPLGRFLSTLGISVMDWHGDLAIGCNSQTQIPIGRTTNLIGRVNINNRGAGQFSVKINSSEQLQIVLIGLIPLVKKVMGYSQQAQFG